ncbi:MAG: phosphotransferase [Deltaproteobacteria bacterium]|nr:phosphotransferase [Deltaproteobacteria bacterium]
MLSEIRGGFKILASEVLQAASETRDLLRRRDPVKSRELFHRTSYIATQSALVQNQALELYAGRSAAHGDSIYLQALSSVASRLERVSEIFLNLDRQAGYLSSLDFLKPFSLDEFFHEILFGLGRIEPALERKDLTLAIRLGQVEERLDGSYADRFARIIDELKKGDSEPGDLVTALMIVHYLERVGDMLLEIGEKIIYVIMGEKIKLEQYKALGEGLRATGRQMDTGRMGYRSIWGGRSGCRIGVVDAVPAGSPCGLPGKAAQNGSGGHGREGHNGAVRRAMDCLDGANREPGREGRGDAADLGHGKEGPDTAGGGHDGRARDGGRGTEARKAEALTETVLFKHGPAFKLTREREALLRWSALRPGLTPDIKAFIPAREGSEATLVLEYIPSRNLQALFMDNAPDDAFEGLDRAMGVMCGIWEETCTEAPCSAGFARQAEGRLSEAQCIFPQILKYSGAVGRMEVRPVGELLPELAEMEGQSPAPRSMLIHGDFNLGNVLYDPAAGRVHMLDLYRSRESDFVQDVSVMLISLLRLPILTHPVRRRLTAAAARVWDAARRFAARLGDDTYEARLAFGLGRSFLTSTRFLMDEKMAARFAARARYLFEKLLAFRSRGRPLEDFRLSRDILEIQVS